MTTNNYNKTLSVSIMMATYNGSKYIKEQLISLQKQTFINWKLWIRDDLSTDGTVAIIEKFEEMDNRIHLIRDSKRRLGNVANFGEVMRHADATDFYMFCDQDDVWYPDKIEVSVKKLLNEENWVSYPLLAFTDAEAVDQNLKTIAPSFLNKIHVNPHDENRLNRLLAQNYIYGCTMIFNQALFSICTPIPEDSNGHDYWVALVAALNGDILFINKPTLKYRQHENNVTGLKQGSLLNRIKRNMTFSGWKRINGVTDNCIHQVNILRQNIYRSGRYKDREFLVDKFVEHGSRGGIKAVFFLMKNNVSKQGRLRSFIYYLSMIRLHKKV